MRRLGGVAAIDIGTTKICTLVGGFGDDGSLHITGSGITASRGMAKGIVDDVGKATEAITASIREAEKVANSRIVAATVGIAGAHITSLNSRGTVALPNAAKPITAEDVQRALEGARTVAIPNNREILHALPRFYVLDGEESTGHPVGKFGHRLDVEAHIVTGAVTAIHNLTKCVEDTGVSVEELVLEPMAAADAVLDEEERTHGVVLVDIGGGTTDIAVFVEGAILHTAVLPVGGNNITSDVVYRLRCPFSAADAAKEYYGSAMASQVEKDETFEIDAFGSDRVRVVSRRQLCEIIQGRVTEMFGLVADEIRRAGYDDMISAGVVLTGGSSNLPGIAELAEQTLNLPARVGAPVGVGNLDQTLSNPAFATSIGLLAWSVRQHDAVLRPARARDPYVPAGRSAGGIWGRFRSLARIMLPE